MTDRIAERIFRWTLRLFAVEIALMYSLNVYQFFTGNTIPELSVTWGATHGMLIFWILGQGMVWANKDIRRAEGGRTPDS